MCYICYMRKYVGIVIGLSVYLAPDPVCDKYVSTVLMHRYSFCTFSEPADDVTYAGISCQPNHDCEWTGEPDAHNHRLSCQFYVEGRLELSKSSQPYCCGHHHI